jgi:membrane protease YdiL (CAAX protease family)
MQYLIKPFPVLMNTYLKYQPPGIQFVAFLGLASGFFILNYVITSLFFSDISNVLLDKSVVITPEVITRFKWAQFAGAVVSFILPVLLFGYFSSPQPFKYVGVYKSFSVIIALLAIVLLFAIQPFVGWLGNLNQKVHFGSMHQALKDAEALYTRALEAFLKMNSVNDYLINLFIMALLPAIGEELFFRGGLQKILLRWNKRPWLSILISSLVFALLHGTFFKIVPIFVLGLMLGTVYHVTRNIWYTIIIHFLNNALAVSAVYFADRSDVLKKLASDDFTLPILLSLLSLVVTLGIIYLMKKKSDEVLPAFATNDDNDYIA